MTDPIRSKFGDVVKCEVCYHTDLAAVFSKCPGMHGPKSIHMKKTQNAVKIEFVEHLYLESNKPLCDPKWGNSTTTDFIQAGIYNDAGVVLTGDELKAGAASCALRGLAVLSQKRRLLIHGSFVCHEYMLSKGIQPRFVYNDIDVLMLDRSTKHFKDIVRSYIYMANTDPSYKIDIIRTRATCWQETVAGRDMNIGSIFLEWNDLGAPVDTLGFYRDNWWFVGQADTAAALLTHCAEYYRSDDDLSIFAAKSRERKKKYIERGFTFVDLPREIDDSYLDIYYTGESTCESLAMTLMF